MRKIVLMMIGVWLVHCCFSQQLKNDENICFTPVEIRAEFPGGIKAWRTYLINHTNTSLGTKYLKIPKGETSEKKSVMVSFVINEEGYIKDVKADSISIATVNKQLVSEAIRVIKESPKWKPASLNGKNISDRQRQPITFFVSKN